MAGLSYKYSGINNLKNQGKSLSNLHDWWKLVWKSNRALDADVSDSSVFVEEVTAYANSVLARLKKFKFNVLFLLDCKVLLLQVTYAVSHKQSMTKIL